LNDKIFVLDWLPASIVARRGHEWLKNYLNTYDKIGNLVVYHNPTSWRGVYYYSSIFKRIPEMFFDPLEVLLNESDLREIDVFIGYHWVPEKPEEMWVCPSEKETESAIRVIDETYRLYSDHVSLKGYYAVWEPGDLSSIRYYKETFDYVKSLDDSLLTAVAPYVFSSREYYGGQLPLIFNALSRIESLDIVIAQSSNSVYPYPPYQGRIHLLLAKSSLNGKKVLGHIETFGRKFLGEKYASEKLIKSQVLSESLVYGLDGISSFTFTYLLDEPTGKSLTAYIDSLKDFLKIQGLIDTQPFISLFLPRRPEYWVFAQEVLKMFRILGLDVSLIQLPLNGTEFKINDKSLIILPDPPELDKEETSFLEEYVRKNGTILVTGYPPEGIREVLGIEERNVGRYGGVEIVQNFRRNHAGKTLELGYRLVYCPTLMGAKPLAFLKRPDSYGGIRDIGGYAATLRKYGRGLAVFTGVPIKTLLKDIPSLFLDLVDLCLVHTGRSLMWEFKGVNESIDTVVRDKLLILLNHGDLTEIEAEYLGNVKKYEIHGKCQVSVKQKKFKIRLNSLEYCCIILH